ncbi:crAss001_48 related protein [Limosilactobacillus antri]|uniref:crAss001_48 related protein n=1 Tax=Limosilactobacillus antri TaxID=227943 RepID=UPI001F57590D|nr:hypothetical protein [Limosilactobacillus antri]
MPIHETLNKFITGIKSGKYQLVASEFSDSQGSLEFNFTVDVLSRADLLERLKKEYQDLTNWCDRLVDFVLTSEFGRLSPEERDVLFNQYDAMSVYQKILRKRIEMTRKRLNEE